MGADIFKKWDWQERQAKFIVNSVRVYEYWGYNWWLPFWDNDFMYFWQKIPLIYRKNKLLYNDYVDFLYKKVAGKEGNNENCKIKFNNNQIFYLKYFIKKLRLYYPIVNFKRTKIKYRFNNIFGALGRYPVEFISKNRKKVNSLNGFGTIWSLEEIKRSLC